MRILTWNCCHGHYSERFARIEDLKPDVTIIPEVAEPMFRSPNVQWARVSQNYGIAVGAYNDFAITRIGGDEPLHRCVHGYHISGPNSFNLLACWSHDPNEDDYRTPWVNGVAAYEPHLKDEPLVVAGDFNDHPMWNKDYRNHEPFQSLLDRFCKKHKLVSAYHGFHREQYGEESRFTHFNNRKSKGYHIDYVLVPEAWRVTKVTIGSRIFDHMPLLVTIAG
ncbi:MAG TPA: endonuclease/exonuclease/phosphatase family protein [Candidatus Saccharimonadales bacterium]|nr:endonuclease/exonuclease/phosphatase family protein [Candidatus Saccharimonadales bacterium]